MAGEKKRVSQEIVSRIESQRDQLLQELNKDESQKRAELLESYKKSVDNLYKEKLDRLKENQSQVLAKEASFLNFQKECDLKRYRSDLLEDFKAQLLKDIIAFKEDKEAYKAYFDGFLKDLEAGGKVILNPEDKDLLEGHDLEFDRVELGGFMYEIDNKIYDYSLKNRFDSAINYFIENSKVWIGSDDLV